jgi:hypothetical protein
MSTAHLVRVDWGNLARSITTPVKFWQEFEKLEVPAPPDDFGSSITLMRPSLADFERFDASFTALTDSKLNTALIWGTMFVLIQVRSTKKRL